MQKAKSEMDDIITKNVNQPLEELVNWYSSASSLRDARVARHNIVLVLHLAFSKFSYFLLKVE